MSKYTTELRFLIESGFDIGLKEYPIFDEKYRATLNAKIIDHYFFREIGFETAGLFKRFLNRTMNEIMPYYNQLYKSESIKYSPLFNKEIMESYERDNTSTSNQSGNGEQNSTSTGINEGKNIFSDTPQGLLELEEIVENLYASSATFDKSSGTSDTNTTNNSTASMSGEGKEIFSRDYKGRDGDASELLKSFRSTFLNIDMLIIDELNSLFMGIW